MKNLITYLSKKSLSLENGSGMTRKWFGNDSGMTRFSLASLICLCMLTLGVGNAWASDYSKNESWDFSTSGNANWTCSGGGSYCGGYGIKNASFSVSKYGISNFEGVNFSNHENVSLTIYVKAGTNSGTNQYTVKLLDGDGNVISGAAYTKTKSGGMGTGTNASSASESSLEFTPTVAFSGYKVEFLQKGFITKTRYVLTYDDKAGGCANQVNITNSSTTSVSHGSFDVDKTGAQDACSALSVVVTPDPDDHYHVATVSATNPATTGTAGAAVDNGDGTYTITYSANAKGNSTISVTFEEDTKYTVTWMSNGSQHTTTQVYSGEKPTFPSNPSSCDGTSTAFYGWATSTWTGKLDDVSAKTIYLSGDAMPAVSASGTIYHAVFAKESATAFEKITSADNVYVGQKLAIVSNKQDYILPSNFNATTAATHPNSNDSKLTVTSSQVWTITDIDEYGYYKLKNSTTQMGVNRTSGLTSGSAAVGNYSTVASWWAINETTDFDYTVDDCFYMYNWATATYYNFLENSGSSWLSYYAADITSGNKAWYAMKLYQPERSEYLTTCCTKLGSIDGAVSLTQGGTSVTVKDWGAVTNAGKYTVKCYEYNEGTSTWGLKATQENITNRSTGATFSSLTLNAKYKFSVQAIATNAAYCDGDETAVTSINSTSVTSTPFQLRYAIHIDDGTNSDSGWEDYWLDNDGEAEITLSGPRDYYEFKIKGGWTGWWGQGSPQSRIPASTEWTLNGDNNVWLQTWIGGTYTFTVDLSGTNPKVTITFPPANQAAGKIVYWDASIHGNNWTKLIFRVGTDANSNAGSDCKVSGQLVPGTDQFYKVTTAAFNDMRAWAIANNAGWTGSQTNGVYRTNDFGDYNVTKSSVYQDYVVGNDGVTLIPASVGTIGDKSYNNNCYFYSVTKYDGMLTHNVAITASTPAAGGSVTATYTNTSGTGGQTVTEGNNADLAHRCILNVTATPNTGYKVETFTKNAAAFAGGNYILTEDVTFAATFSLKTTTVTLNNHGATTAGATSVTATYSQAVPSIAANLPAKTGYEFQGYFTGENGEGTKYINADGTSANNWLIEDATTTLHAYWTPKRCTVTLTAGTGTNGEAKYDYDATTYYSFTPAVRVGYTCNGYWTGSGGTGTKILNADGSRAANVAGWWVDGKWAKDATSATLYAGWTNTYGGDEFELVLDLSELSAGKKIIIMNAGHDKALSTTQNTNNRGQVLANADGGFTMSGDNNVATLKAATTVQVITLESTGTANRYYLNVEDGYLYAPGTSSNYYLKTRANNSSNAEQGQFNFALSNGDFTISAQSSTNKYLRHNNGSSLFSCYNTAGSQSPVLVYVKRESCDAPANALSLSASPTTVSTATGYNTSTLSVNGGNGNAVTYRVISDNKANATISGTTTKTFSATVAGTYTVQAFQLKNDNICRQIATTDITVTTPVLTTSKTSHTFDKTKTGNTRTTNTVTVSGANLVGDVSVTYTGHTAYFTVTPSSISASDAMSSAQALTISYAPTVAGSHSITITISSPGAEDKTVTVNGTAADFYDVTFHISGSSDVVRSVESGQKPVLPDAPASCDATSTAFIGWATEPWVGKIASVAGKTIHTSNTTMPAVTTATHYYAVWANETSSVTDQTASFGFEEASPSAWTISNISQYASAYASGSYSGKCDANGNGNIITPNTIQYNTKLTTPTSISFKTARTGNTNAGNYWQVQSSSDGSIWSNVTDGAGPNHSQIANTNTFTDPFEVDLSDLSNVYIRINHNGSSPATLLDDIVLSYKAGSTTYSDYLTTCCENTGLTFGTILSPVTSYEIVRTSSAAATIDCNFESSTATAITWYKTSRAARTFVTPTGATSSTAPSSQLAEMTIDMSNKELTASSVGIYTIIIKQDEATIAGQKYCESFAEVTVTVKVRDRFVDLVNGVAVDADDGNPTITKDDTGGGIYTPTESEFSEDDICKSTRRKLIGWIKESDLNTGYTGRVNDITDMKTDNPATNKVIAPNTQVEATGCTWYAVWADID